MYAQWEIKLEKDPVTLPGQEEWVEFRDIKYGEEKIKVDKYWLSSNSWFCQA